MDVSDKTVLFWDASASYTHMAECVVPEFKRVMYFTPWEKGFSVSRDYIPGTGLEGIEKVRDFFDALDDADLVVFTDVGMSGLQEYLRRQGMPVFGSGRAAELERDRWKLKKSLSEADIDYSDGYLVRSFDTLRKLLQQQDDLYVKFSDFRGDWETAKHRTYEQSRKKLAQLELALGPYGDIAEFIIEPPIEGDDCVEIGADPPWVCDGRFPQKFLWGYEQKDAGYAGCVHQLPKRMEEVLGKLSPLLLRYDYRGPLSTETREDKEGHSYVIDLSCRFPEPPSSVHSYMCENWGEMMYGCAVGEPVEPDYIADYAVEIVLRSEAGAEHPLAVDLGESSRVRLHGHTRIGGVDYAVSPSEIRECGAACGIGDSLSDAMEEALEAAHSVKGDEIEFDAASLRALIDTIRDGRKLDLDFGAIQGAQHAASETSGS